MQGVYHITYYIIIMNSFTQVQIGCSVDQLNEETCGSSQEECDKQADTTDKDIKG